MAIKADGVDDRISVSDSVDWDFGTSDFGISITFKFANTTQVHTLFEFGRVGASTGIQVNWNSTTAKVEVYLNGAQPKNDAWSPSADTWYNYCLRRIGTSLQNFIDGTEIGASVTDSTNISGGTQGIAIFSNTVPSNFMTGTISEFAMWNGAGINDVELQNLSKSRIKGIPLQFNVGSLVIYLPLDEFSDGATASGTGVHIDRSPKGNNGTPNNSPVSKAEEYLTYP